jgi:nucleoside-diphosphate-sugar epimerase
VSDHEAISAQRIVVTGATGFLGGAVARRLRATHPTVELLALGRDVARGAALHEEGIAFAQLELTDARTVTRTLRAGDVVVHAAALSSPWGPYPAFHAANIVASDNLVQACVQADAARLVHISTPGIYHDGTSRHGIREEDPLPAHAVNHYVATKRESEQRVLATAAAHRLPVLALRPRAIFGPGDSAILPRIARALRAGRMRRIGDGDCIIDMSYIDNVVDAVLLAADAPRELSGRAYNITNGEPIRIWNVIDHLADVINAPRPRKRISRRKALLVARMLETGYGVFAPQLEPPLLCYGVDLLSVDMTLDISRARDELGYRPRVSMENALATTFAELVHEGVCHD